MTFDASQTLVIANPAAAGGRVGRRADAMRTMVTAALGDVRFVTTERPGHASELAEQAVRDNLSAVLSLGGDGTHHEVVQGLARAGTHDTALGVLPAGTGGDLRRSLAATTLPAMLRALPTLPRRRVDLGHATYRCDAGGAGERWFVNVASCGVGGAVDRAVNASRKRLGALSFLAATVGVLARYRAPTVRVTVDGESLGARRVALVGACNGRYAGGGMCFGPTAKLDDGLLDVVVVDDAPMLKSLFDVRHLYAGTLTEVPRVTTRRGREVTVELLDGEALVDLDGESPGRAPVTFSVRPGALWLLG